MFYYPAVLKRHTGCFSTIWLVATKGIKIPRRDFLKVNVKSTCDDIMNYVLEQVPPPLPGLPRPRFSLYLSSQLQYGVVVVYHRQCVILLEELQSVVGQLVKKRTSQKIDMDDDSRQGLDLPDALSHMEKAEGAPDPLFGVMYMQDPMPSPNTLIQTGQEYWRDTSPEHPEQISPAAAAPDSDITASPETITLRETEPVAIPVAEYEGVELDDQHLDTLDLLLAETDHFPEGDLEMQIEEVTPGDEDRELERVRQEGDLERDRAKELTGSIIELQPAAIDSEDTLVLLQEELPLSVEKPGPPTDQLTPVSAPVLPSPPSELMERERPTLESEPTPPERPQEGRRSRRKRQLVFFDPDTQLSQEEQQQQIDNPQTETRSPPLLPPPSQRMTPAAELLNNPCNFLPEEVLFLWRQAATVTPVSDSDLQVGERGPESTDSDKEREPEMVEAVEREEERTELSPKEIARDVAELEVFDISVHGSLPLEGSDLREASREISPLYTSEREGSSVSRSATALQDIPEVLDELERAAAESPQSSVSRSATALQDIPEVLDELERAAAESPQLLPELAEHEEAPVLFQSLLPPEVDRRTVSNIFQRLLENLSAGRVRVEQNEPYGDILILPGPEYEDVTLNL